MKYIQGKDRLQKTMFPDLIDDYIEDGNPVRFIDAFVNNLNLKDLGFKYSDSNNGSAGLIDKIQFHHKNLQKLILHLK